MLLDSLVTEVQLWVEVGERRGILSGYKKISELKRAKQKQESCARGLQFGNSVDPVLCSKVNLLLPKSTDYYRLNLS